MVPMGSKSKKFAGSQINKELGRAIGLDYTGYRLVIGEKGQDGDGLIDRGRSEYMKGLIILMLRLNSLMDSPIVDSLV